MYREQERQRTAERHAARSFKVEQFETVMINREEREQEARHFVRAFSRREVR